MPQASRGKTKAGLDSAEAREVFSAIYRIREQRGCFWHRAQKTVPRVISHQAAEGRVAPASARGAPGHRRAGHPDTVSRGRASLRVSPEPASQEWPRLHAGPTSNQSPSGSSACSWAWANQDAALALGGLSGRKEWAVLPGPRGRGTLPRGPEPEEVWLRLCGRRGWGAAHAGAAGPAASHSEGSKTHRGLPVTGITGSPAPGAGDTGLQRWVEGAGHGSHLSLRGRGSGVPPAQPTGGRVVLGPATSHDRLASGGVQRWHPGDWGIVCLPRTASRGQRRKASSRGRAGFPGHRLPGASGGVEVLHERPLTPGSKSKFPKLWVQLGFPASWGRVFRM